MQNEVYKFLEREEGRKLKSYKDSAGVWTIGVGSTMYTSGAKVGPNEVITDAEADELRNWEVENKANVVAALTGKLTLTDNQIVALISFAYNEGVGALANSTLLKEIKKDPNSTAVVAVDKVPDISVKKYMQDHGWKEVNIIRMCFMMWNKVKNPRNGLKEYSEAMMNRRLREADLYFTK